MTGTKLFIVESQSAGEGMTPPGPWLAIGEADTLAEAQAMVVADNAKGWRYARVVANVEMVEAHRVEAAQLRLDALREAVARAVKSGRAHHLAEPQEPPDLHFFLGMLTDLDAALKSTEAS